MLSGNENLISIKGNNSVFFFRKTTGNNPNVHLVNINAHTQFGQILLMSSQDNERKRKSDIKDNNSVTNLRKMTGHNPKLDIVNINAHTKFDQLLFNKSKDIERKRKYDINQGP